MHPLLETHEHRGCGAFLFLPPPSLPSVHLEGAVTRVLYVRDGAANVVKIQLHKANGYLYPRALGCLTSSGYGSIIPSENKGMLRTGV